LGSFSISDAFPLLGEKVEATGNEKWCIELPLS